MELVRTNSNREDSFYFNPRLTVNHLYYIEGNAVGNAIVSINLEDGTRRIVRRAAAPYAKVTSFAVSEPWIAVVEFRNDLTSGADVILGSTISGEWIWLTTSRAWESPPVFGNGKLYWSEAAVVPPAGQLGGTEDEHDIYAYDLATQVTKPVVTAPGSQIVMAADGAELMWFDFRDGYWGVENRMGATDIYWGNVETTEERRLTLSPRARWALRRFGERYGWMQNEAPPNAPDALRVWTAPLPRR